MASRFDQGRENKARNICACPWRGGQGREKSGQGTLERIKRSIQVILEKGHFPSSLLLLVCRRKGWPAGLEQDCSRGCALEGLAMTREVDQVKPAKTRSPNKLS